MIKYLDNKDERECCGCGICQEICPTKGIQMMKNKEGFFYPSFYESVCISCGKCEDICPMNKDALEQRPLAAYGVQHDDSEILKNSSSGGMFSLLGEWILNEGGYVVGCIWNEKGYPELKLTNQMEEIEKMKGSKYVAARTKGIYTKVRKVLEAGKYVLFTGTPCQCSGLQSYLGKSYEKLYVMDFFCHGVPSEDLFFSYIQYLENKYAANITDYSFRKKDKNGCGVRESFAIGNKEKSRPGLTSPYIYGFLKGYFHRYSCYDCHFQGNLNESDFTVGDFWGYKKIYKQLNYKNGISACILRTGKGEILFHELNKGCHCHLVEMDSIGSGNRKGIYGETENVPVLRHTIYSDIQKLGWKIIGKKELRCKDLYKRLIWDRMPEIIRRPLRIIKGK